MSEENSKEPAFKEVQIQGQLLKFCLEKFPMLQGKTQVCQLKKIQNKYQFYLRKYQKFTEEHQKYKQLYSNIQRMVEQSPQIKQENRSIEFINKVMQQTFKKYNKLKESVDEIKSQRANNQSQKVRLKNILLKMKSQFFELERKDQELEVCKKRQDSCSKTKQNLKTMFKIRNEKRSLQKQFRIKPIEFNKLTLDVSFAQRKIVNELETINTLKKEFLSAIGTNMAEYQKLNLRVLRSQEHSNKLISKKQFCLRKGYLQKLDSYEPDREAFQILRITNEYDQQFEDFMGLSGEQILQMIIKKNKVSDMLQLIEEEKRGMVEGYRRNKQERLRI